MWCYCDRKAWNTTFLFIFASCEFSIFSKYNKLNASSFVPFICPYSIGKTSCCSHVIPNWIQTTSNGERQQQNSHTAKSRCAIVNCERCKEMMMMGLAPGVCDTFNNTLLPESPAWTWKSEREMRKGECAMSLHTFFGFASRGFFAYSPCIYH